ncbi:MAG: hypothetical protein COZ28_02675 [Candidatus Moranbacteria bacterium CG_4_10_14_3_um_filter_44_15]|nr:MAG: hypothetical protein COS72_00065 [Candidatus Moranbacteria bacterium CG06_land_8_20_14_3_00_43_56]PIV83948.1 MAG: hypothetical protein COW51_02315 [Candidatus Moranbacteria bacterium CG17_big_fil_post_rev_8_21_14_2_50_44_12]PIW93187.1 MAG: hypothetical protein COZ87_02650 [Candidatus Moranbacteria bacterium CG_4_8_14_3_um_filter_43_15]PIX90638.1 MAG: hypothetical protein COZ28_02675 [Candidatus Moranbacteria bacterium CG_4_10_14_3_um_filter_44_15]PJA85533.1 MAG: hypothetical protein CO1
MYDLISIGSVVKDLILITNRGKIFKTPKDKLAPEWLGFELGEKIRAENILESDGGVATNLLIGTKKFGLKSASIGPAKKAVSVIIVDRKTGERIIFYEKTSGTINLINLKNTKTKWLSVSSLTGNWNQQAGKILAYIKQKKAKLILAPSTSMIRDEYKNLKKLLKNAEIIFLNKNEAIEITANEKIRNTNVKILIKLLHKLGPKIVCLTDGRKGAYASNGKKIYYSPIKKVKTVDVTGAGDAFASGFLGFYLKGALLENSLKAGIINSANVVKYVGTTKGLMTKREIGREL